jgi:hypothetical protein
MAYDFPNDPAFDDLYDKYRWDGEKWTTSALNPPPPPVSTIFTQAPPITGSDANPNLNFRMICTLAADMGSEFRITLQPGTSLTCVGLAAGYHNGDFFPNSTVPLVPATFAGAPGFTSQSTPQTSDWTPSGALADMVAGDKLIVSFMTGPSGQGTVAYTAGSTNSTCMWQSDDGTLWDDQTVSGYNNIGASVYGVASIETRGGTGGGGTEPPIDPPSDSLIPMSFDDPMFTGMTELTAALTLSTGQNLTRRSIEEYSGDPSISCTSNNTISYCRVQSREAVRITGSATMHHCYFEATGVEPDHADVVQHYSEYETGAVVVVQNCHIRAHTVAATAGYFIADWWSGSVSFENVIFQSGPHGTKIHSDTGCHLDLSFKNCFYVGPFSNPYDNVAFIFGEYGGTITFLKWENVRHATIVDGVLVPGALIPQPIPWT